MGINAETHLAVAQEHADLARKLYSGGDYAPVHYLAGLAVECLLRAYRVRFDPRFDCRHVLADLVKAAKFYDAVSPARQEQTSAALSEVTRLWRNDHRFRSRDSLRKWVKQQLMSDRIKGDVLKEGARRIANAALEVVSEGVRRWPK